MRKTLTILLILITWITFGQAFNGYIGSHKVTRAYIGTQDIVQFAPQGRVLLTLQENEDASYTITPIVNRAGVLNSAPKVVGLGSSTLNGTGATAGNQLRDLFTTYITNKGGQFAEVATGGYFTDRILPYNTNDSDIRPHENSTALSAIDADIAIVMLPSNDMDDGVNTAQQYFDNQVLIKEELEKKGIFTFIQDAQPRDQFNATEKQRIVDAANLILNDTEIPLEQVIESFYQLRDPATTADILAAYNSGDNVHLNNAGHLFLHDQILVPTLEEYFTATNVVAIELERSTNPTSEFSVIDTDLSEAGESFLRIDAQTYYFRARIRFTDSSYSDYSNVVEVSQPLEFFATDETTKINFTNTGTSLAGWNIWDLTGHSIGSNLSGLLADDNSATGYTITLQDQAFQSSDAGIIGGVYPDAVMGTSWRIDAGVDILPKLEITGLSNAHIYNIKIISSENTAAIDRYTSAYCVEENLVDGVYSGLSNNGSDLITLNGLRPVSGELNIQLAAPWFGLGFINGLILERRSNGTDVTAPVLTVATDDESSATITTDEGNGTLYWVVTQSSTTPSVAQIQAGQDHTGSAGDANGSEVVSTIGVQNVSYSGLIPATTYYTHFVHTDAAGNDSNTISGNGFTPASTPSAKVKVPTTTHVGQTRGYIEYLPANYASRKDWPILIYLHGTGATGDGSSAALDAVINNGVMGWLNSNDRDFIVLAPQDGNGLWGDRGYTFVNWAVNTHYVSKIDGNSIHMIYNSGGGGGFDRFFDDGAAIADQIASHTPVAALTGNPGTGAAADFIASGASIWFHHDTGDPTVGVGQTRNWYEAIIDANGTEDLSKFRYTEYNRSSHGTQSDVYTDDGINETQQTGTISGTAYSYYHWTSGSWWTWLEDQGTPAIPAAPMDIFISANNIDEETTGVVGTLSDDGTPQGTFTITGGADQANFTIYGNNLEVSTSFDYETQTTAQIQLTSTNATGSYAEIITVTINDVVEDNTAPVLALATATQTGATTGSGTVTTDEGNGTLYYYVSQNSGEVLGTVKGSGSTQAVSASGIQAVTVSGLTPATTYYIHFAHTDAAGNDSNVISGNGFTTNAGGTAPIRVLINLARNNTVISPDANSRHWNNILSDEISQNASTAGYSFGSTMVDTDGNNTTITFTLDDPFDNNFGDFAGSNGAGGTASTIGDYVNPAGFDSWFSQDPDTGSITIGGLSAGSTYLFRFWGSRAATGDRDMDVATLSNFSNAQTFRADNNTNYNQAAEHTVSGSTSYTFYIRSTPGASVWGYLGVIDIQEQ